MTEQIVCRAITGPTASGKTGLSVRLAQEQGWDILCMDSMQIYRRMNIGTAKPTKEEMGGVPHHLMDICEPTDAYSVSDYRDAAEKLVLQLSEKGRNVLFVGGTVLYLQALMHPMGMGMTPANEELRKELNVLAETGEGRTALHERLRNIDPVTAQRLPVNDVRRIIRAIEVWEATGIPFSAQPKRDNENDRRFCWKVVSTEMDRALLYERINDRVTDMIRRGLKEEVASLLAEGVPEDARSMNGLGYKEMIPCIRGECSVEEAAELIRKGTRHYAKRQMTFLRREECIRYVRTDREDAYNEMKRYLL
ncbi:MAG: tRNA (adenosine(37)-N6)-dimethylallyltransferase MiaA [Clostridia bacterium]|nr:tRNA (adenosine(37)-N6)-dimethylallyltransferase MiaA [Clostridia bacterium]